MTTCDVLEVSVVLCLMLWLLYQTADYICHYGTTSSCCAGRQVAAAGWFGRVATVDIFR